MPKPTGVCSLMDCQEAATHRLAYQHVSMYSAQTERVCAGHGLSLMVQLTCTPAQQAAYSVSLNEIGE